MPVGGASPPLRGSHHEEKGVFWERIDWGKNARFLESTELPQVCKDALTVQCALYNPVELRQNVNKAILRLRQRLAQVNRIQTREQAWLR
jgi:hypothetical protein